MNTGTSQFAPAAGKPGSTALKYDSVCFVGWATGCEVTRGLRDVSRPDSGYTDAGTPLSATGKALQNGVVSLGDGGSATLTFASPLINGPGWDFAVFENSFLDTFLELAFVEVSSDGKLFVRFPAVSLTDTNQQTGAFGYTYPEKINNLAGKYRAGFGTPFELEELKDSSGIDISNITHVRIRDVVGSLAPKFATHDSKGNKINDPWPTPFPSSGFDLDAVGIIHQKPSSRKDIRNNILSINVWPNPINTELFSVQSGEQGRLEMYSLSGIKIDQWKIQIGRNELKTPRHTGMYYLVFTNGSNTFSYNIEIIR